MPKGAYVPLFAVRQPLPSVVAMPEEARPDRKRRPWALILIGSVLLSAALGYWIGRSPAPPLHPIHPLWSRVFSSDRDTVFVACDSGLVLFENLTQQSVSLPEYMSRDYRAQSRAAPPGLDRLAVDLGARRYTTIVDLQLAARLARLREAAPNRFRIRFSRDVQLGQLKEGNLIVSGAQEANPWLELFQKKLNFQFLHDEKTRLFRVINQAPQEGERAQYENYPGILHAVRMGCLPFSPVSELGASLYWRGQRCPGPKQSPTLC